MALTYTLTKPLFHRLKGKYVILKCDFCGKTLNEGDVVVSKPSQPNKTKHYHQQCYERLWM